MERLDVSDGCHLQLLDERDAEGLYRLVERNRDYLADWLPWAAGQTLEGVREFIQKMRRQVVENDGFQGALFLEGRMVGAGGFVAVSWESRATSLGYWLDEGHQGRGLMTATVKALTDHAFDAWDLNRVEIQVGTDNRKSRGIPERLGFHQEGVLREYERVGGRYIDIVVYSLLASDRR